MIYHHNSTQAILKNKRKNHRFFLSKGTVVWLTLQTEENLLEESIEAMILDDSSDGCGLIIVKDSPLISEQLFRLKQGDFCSINFEKKPPIVGKIIWYKPLDDLIIRLGIKYNNY